jgi:hypothetical protein
MGSFLDYAMVAMCLGEKESTRRFTKAVTTKLKQLGAQAHSLKELMQSQQPSKQNHDWLIKAGKTVKEQTRKVGNVARDVLVTHVKTDLVADMKLLIEETKTESMNDDVDAFKRSVSAVDVSSLVEALYNDEALWSLCQAPVMLSFRLWFYSSFVTSKGDRPSQAASDALTKKSGLEDTLSTVIQSLGTDSGKVNELLGAVRGHLENRGVASHLAPKFFCIEGRRCDAE